MKSMMAWPVLVLGLLTASSAVAADYSDPEWPCVQRKVESLSVGLMWPYPVDETSSGKLDPDTEDLVGRFALRRLELPEIEPALAEFTATHGASPEVLGQVFVEAFDRLAKTRRVIMQGIAEYSLSQIALAEKIDGARSEMETLMAAESPDYDRVDELEAQVDWDERIYTDRAKSLTYVCETPVLLEKRIYAIAQMLLAASEE